MQDILLVGLSHKSAPLEVRESVSFLGSQLSQALPPLRDRVGEAVILSTCNRTEIYAVTDDTHAAADSVMQFVADYHALPQNSVAPHIYTRAGADAVRHLFSVAGGLDSMIVGESQILGQVRESLRAATEADAAKASSVRLFHNALRVGRRVRQETAIGRNPLSISYAGVRLAQRVLGNLSDKRALLIGAGEAGSLIARALRTVGIGDLMIANRTTERAQELASYLNGRVVPFDRIDDALTDADIALAATDSPSYIVTQRTASGIRRRADKPLFAFDLAIPRDIDPTITGLGDVRLFNIDDLSAIAEENMAERKRAAADAESIIAEEVAAFLKWWGSLDALPTIRAIRQDAERIRRRELAKALDMLDSVSAQNRQVVEALTHSIVNKILHDPTASLRQGANKTQIRAARDLFRVEEEE